MIQLKHFETLNQIRSIYHIANCVQEFENLINYILACPEDASSTFKNFFRVYRKPNGAYTCERSICFTPLHWEFEEIAHISMSVFNFEKHLKFSFYYYYLGAGEPLQLAKDEIYIYKSKEISRATLYKYIHPYHYDTSYLYRVLEKRSKGNAPMPD